MGLGPEGLDCAMFMNLERRKDRYWFAMGGLSALNFKEDQIIPFVSHDGQHYESIDSVHDAAFADGFEEFDHFRAESRNHAAWYWTYRGALREIRDSGKTTLLFIDDHLPKPGWNYIRLSYLVDYCEFRSNDYGDFRILQCCHTFFGDEQNFFLKHTPETGMLQLGLAGGFDIGNIISPLGAELLLREAKNQPLDRSPDALYSSLYRKQSEGMGLWHTIDEVCSHFFVWGTDDFSGYT